MKTTAEMFDEAGRITKATMKTMGLSVAMNSDQFNAVFSRVVDALTAEGRAASGNRQMPSNKMPMDELERLKIIGEYRNEVQRDIRLAFTFHQNRFSEPNELVALQDAILAVL